VIWWLCNCTCIKEPPKKKNPEVMWSQCEDVWVMVAGHLVHPEDQNNFRKTCQMFRRVIPHLIFPPPKIMISLFSSPEFFILCLDLALWCDFYDHYTKEDVDKMLNALVKQFAAHYNPKMPLPPKFCYFITKWCWLQHIQEQIPMAWYIEYLIKSNEGGDWCKLDEVILQECFQGDKKFLFPYEGFKMLLEDMPHLIHDECFTGYAKEFWKIADCTLRKLWRDEILRRRQTNPDFCKEEEGRARRQLAMVTYINKIFLLCAHVDLGCKK
jgi:hypothetical protein